jgi:hypothetical protein
MAALDEAVVRVRVDVLLQPVAEALDLRAVVLDRLLPQVRA